MTYDAQEISRYSGAPVEFYKFASGATVIGRFTSADAARTIADPDDTNLYAPETIGRGSLRFTQEEVSASITVTIPTANAVAQLFIPYTPPAPVTLTIFGLQRYDGTAEVVPIFVGEVLSARFTGSECQLLVAPAWRGLKRQVPALTVQNQCAWMLFSGGCGLDREDFKDVATLTAVEGLTVSSTTFDARADGYYVNGWLEAADGERRVIVAHVGPVVTVAGPMPASFAVSAEVFAFAGCDRTEVTCRVKFNNLVHHLGFPRVPGRNPHDGTSLI